ncbi:MAG: ABC transporter ATP-binding protein [Oscillospiraceae bacterium]|nr:ABC transporter ATP-binding protein [Oscillospiraceae bacterium]
MTPLLEVRGVCAGYRGVEAVRSVSFGVRAGERVSIIGPNGCGKTTLLKAMCNLIPLTGGGVLIDGINPASMSRRAAAKKISMMAQISELWFDFTVAETVLMGRYARQSGRLSSNTNDDMRVVEECLLAVGMTSSANESITRLSGGQRQLVMLARAFAQEPRIIVLDEPTNHLDLKHQAELFGYLLEWVTKPDRAVIQVMHDLNFARMYSDRILLMNDGRLAADGKPDEIMNMSELDDAYDFGVRRFLETAAKTQRELSESGK